MEFGYMDCLISLCWLERAEIELSTSTDIKEIELLCSLFPFEDRSIPYSHLTRRGPTTLEGFLKSLGDTEKVEIERGVGEARLSEKEVRSLRLAGRLGIVLRQRQLSSSPGSAWDWKWKAPDKSTTAKSISDAMMLAFCTVTFADWIRTSFGYYAQSFSKVTGWMSQKREMVRRHLKETPQLRMHYEQLEKELRPLHPWAHWMLKSTIEWADAPDHVYSILTRYEDSDQLCGISGSLIEIIRGIFGRRKQDIGKLLEELVAFGSWVQRRMVKEVDWVKLLSTNMPILNGLHWRTKAEFAMSITEKDYSFFERLCSNDIAALAGDRLGPVEKRLLKLYYCISALATADNNLVKPIIEITRNLISSRNFISSPAGIAALKNVGISQNQMAKFMKLVRTNTGGHFACLLTDLAGLRHQRSVLDFTESEYTQQLPPAMCRGVRITKNPNFQLVRPGMRKSMEIHDGLRLTHIQVVSRLILVVATDCNCSKPTPPNEDMTVSKARKHELEAPEDGCPRKQGRLVYAESQDVVTPLNHSGYEFVPRVEKSGSPVATAESSYNGLVVPPLQPLTPPGSPQHQSTPLLPNINEFDASLSRLRASAANGKPNIQKQFPSYDQSRGSNYAPYFSREFAEQALAGGKPFLPPLCAIPAAGTTDPCLSGMFAEAARATGRSQFYLTSPVEAANNAVSSGETYMVIAPSVAQKNSQPSEPQIVTMARRVPDTITGGGFPADLGEASASSRSRSEAVWWRMFETPAQKSASTVIPDSFQPDTAKCECSKLVLRSSFKQCGCRVREACQPSDIGMVNRFHPVNQSNLVGRTDTAEASQGLSLLKIGAPSRIHRPRLHQNSQPEYQTINTTTPAPEPFVPLTSEVQPSERYFSPIKRDKGKGRLVESPGKPPGASLPTSEPLEEMIWSSSERAAEFANIYDANLGGGGEVRGTEHFFN